MKRDILDLRFIIGLFFALIGIALVLASFLMETTADKSEITNRWSGLLYIAFGILMIMLWYFGKNENTNVDVP